MSALAGAGGLRSRGSSALVALAVAVLAAGLLLAGAAPASAHNRLVSTDPADGSTVDRAPAALVMVFDEPAIALGTQVVVTGPDGTAVSSGDPQLVDRTVTQQLAGDLPAGQYRVVWRVTSADGHPVSGELAFTASGGGDPSATASPGSAASASGGATATPSETAEPVAAVPTGGSSGSGGVPPWLVVLLVAAGGAAVGAGVLAVGRARRSG